MRWINYQHLFYFWNVARYQSVTRAAEHLRLAQPTISAQLRAFEDVLGEKLFERKGRGITLTECGTLVFQYASQIFTLGQELLDTLDGKASVAHRELKVGIADVVPKSIAYKLIAPAFGKGFGLTVTCLEDKTERLLADLSIGEIDLVIADRPIPPTVKVKAYNHFVGECGIVFLATRELARKWKKEFPRSLARAPLMVPTMESAVRQQLDQWFEVQGITPLIVGAFQDRALMKIAAREGQGIIPVPSVVAADVAKEYHLESLGKTDSIKEQLYLISTERRLKNPLLIRICEEGQKVLYR